MIAIIDYGMGNVRSVERAFRALGSDAIVTADPAVIGTAERLVLPGVGAFGVAMERLRELDLVEVLTQRVLRTGTPFLGICLGMQLLCRESEEHGRHLGLGWINATVQLLPSDQAGIRVPHVGWNDVYAMTGSELIPGGHGVFYFVHSYRVVPEPGSEDVVSATCTYGEQFAVCIEHGNIAATQFHPEKSQEGRIGPAAPLRGVEAGAGVRGLTRTAASG